LPETLVGLSYLGRNKSGVGLKYVLAIKMGFLGDQFLINGYCLTLDYKKTPKPTVAYQLLGSIFQFPSQGGEHLFLEQLIILDLLTRRAENHKFAHG